MSDDVADCNEWVPMQDETFDPLIPLLEHEKEEMRRDAFDKRNNIVRSWTGGWIVAGAALLEIRDEELWREGGSSSWNHYCETLMGITRSYINRLILGVIIIRELSNNEPPIDSEGNPILPVGESQIRPLKKLSDSEERVKAWRIAVQRAGGLPTAKNVAEVVCEMMCVVATKPPPPHKSQRLEVIAELRKEAVARGSWDRVVALIKLLEELES